PRIHTSALPDAPERLAQPGGTNVDMARDRPGSGGGVDGPDLGVGALPGGGGRGEAAVGDAGGPVPGSASRGPWSRLYAGHADRPHPAHLLAETITGLPGRAGRGRTPRQILTNSPDALPVRLPPTGPGDILFASVAGRSPWRIAPAFLRNPVREHAV